MSTIEGLPPGFDFKRAPELPGYKSEQQRRLEKQQQAIQDLNQSLPQGARGLPLEYDPLGAPIIKQPEPQQPMQPPISGHNGPQGVAAPPMQPQQMAGPSVAQRPPKPTHPTILKMLEKFGLKKEERHTLELMATDGTVMRYTMTSISDEVQVWALDEARQRAILAGDAAALTGLFQLLIATAAIVAIDGEPIWRVFGIDPMPSEMSVLSEDPLSLTLRMRRLTASALADLLYSQTIPFGDKIFEFYEDKFIKSRKVFSSFDKEYEGAFRFVCPLDGCVEYLIMKPNLNEDNLEVPYFCKLHGVEMAKTTNLMDATNAPLE